MVGSVFMVSVLLVIFLKVFYFYDVYKLYEINICLSNRALGIWFTLC